MTKDSSGWLDVLVDYCSEEDKKKLEDYIHEFTGERVNLGPIWYDGKLSIKMMSYDLQEIHNLSISYAFYFPNKRFRGVDSFIEWHKENFLKRQLETSFMENSNKNQDSQNIKPGDLERWSKENNLPTLHYAYRQDEPLSSLNLKLIERGLEPIPCGNKHLKQNACYSKITIRIPSNKSNSDC